MNADRPRDRNGEAWAQFFDRNHELPVKEQYRAAVAEVENGNEALQSLVALGLDGVAGESANYSVAKSGGMAEALDDTYLESDEFWDDEQDLIESGFYSQELTYGTVEDYIRSYTEAYGTPPTKAQIALIAPLLEGGGADRENP
jgi:hypothetical protein